MSYLNNLRKWWKKCITYHPPRTDAQRDAHASVNKILEKAGNDLLDIVPACEQTEFMLHQLQIARMWANAALAVHVNNPNKEE